MPGPFISSRSTSGGPVRRPLTLPNDEPVAIAPGPDPDRVLLVGSGPVAGVGVATHRLALTGALARQLVAHTTRGAVVESIGRIDLRLAEIPDLLAATRLNRFDSVVVTAGMAEVAALVSRRAWAHSLHAVLDAVHAEQAMGSTLVVTGMPAPTSTDRVGGWRGLLLDHHALRLNRTTRATVSARRYGHFAPLSPTAHRGGQPTADCYEQWAGQICQVLEPLLNRRGDDLYNERVR